MEDEEPIDADRRTTLEIVGYRNALTYIQQLADDADFVLDESLLRSLHFMMLGHDLTKSPGRYRPGQIFVHDEERNLRVYEGPEADEVPLLMQELVGSLKTTNDACPVFVRAAMAHLNLVMIHPFRDGNGRMARALQTMVLAREKILSPEFSSIEEWLGGTPRRITPCLPNSAMAPGIPAETPEPGSGSIWWRITCRRRPCCGVLTTLRLPGQNRKGRRGSTTCRPDRLRPVSRGAWPEGQASRLRERRGCRAGHRQSRSPAHGQRGSAGGTRRNPWPLLRRHYGAQADQAERDS